MQVRRFMVSSIPAPGKCVVLPPAEAAHAGKVLRLRQGDFIVLLDGQGGHAEAVLDNLGRGRRYEGMSCRVQRREQEPAPTIPVHLYVAPPRPKIMGHVLRCATELGVSRITPIHCEFGVSRPGPEAVDGWRHDVVAGLKQSGNPYLPVIDPPMAFAEALAGSDAPGVYGAVAAAKSKAAAIVPRSGRCAVWIGPEGGFSATEEARLEKALLRPLTVGLWALRIETAVAAVIGMLYGIWADA